jgi:hypothetical protein
MNKRFMAVMVSLLWGIPVLAADAMNKEAPAIQPGDYMASIMPGLNKDMADRVSGAIAGIPGVEKVSASAGESSVHFTIKDHAKVHVTEIQSALAKVNPDAVMTEPILAHSLQPSPGL